MTYRIGTIYLKDGRNGFHKQQFFEAASYLRLRVTSRFPL